MDSFVDPHPTCALGAKVSAVLTTKSDEFAEAERGLDPRCVALPLHRSDVGRQAGRLTD